MHRRTTEGTGHGCATFRPVAQQASTVGRLDFRRPSWQACPMLLLIPGPVTTRPEVREALRYDFAPWDNDFRPLYAGVRERVLRIAGGVPGEHATLPLQGCGHFITEAAIRTFIPLGGKLLIPGTGSYADRMIRLAREAGRIPGCTTGLPLCSDRSRCRGVGAESRTPDQPRRPGLQRDRQRHRPRSGRDRRRRAKARTTAAARCGVGIRRVAAGPFGAAGNRLCRLHLEQVPGGCAGPGVRRGAHRSRRGLRRQCRKLVARPVQHLRPRAAQRLGQLPLYPAGAGAERVQRGARPLSMPKAASPRGSPATPRTCERCTTACAVSA